MCNQMQPDEILFLERHKIPLSQLYDLVGRTVDSCYEEMVAEEKLFGYNAASCTAGVGHKFVTRTGHCIQCEPSGPKCIAEIRRNHGPGDVYIAGSISTSLIKVGSANSADKRVPVLTALGYGGASDWRKLYVVRSIANAGKVEFEIHAKLEKYRIRDISYLKEGKQQVCNELFSCSQESALLELKARAPKGSKIASLLNSELAKYSFPDRPPAQR